MFPRNSPHFVIRAFSPRTQCKAGAGRAPVTAPGRDWSWRCCSSFRQCFEDGGEVATSPTFGWAILDGSALRALWCASLEERSRHLSYTSGGHALGPRRHGGSVGHLLPWRASSRAHLVPDVVSTNGLTRCFSVHVGQWDFFYCKDLGVGIERASRASARLSERACSRRAMDSVLRVAFRRARAHRRLDHALRHDIRHAQSRGTSASLAPVTPKF